MWGRVSGRSGNLSSGSVPVVGLDVGSVAVKAVALDRFGRTLASAVRPIHGRLLATVDAVLVELERAVPDGPRLVAVTGSRSGRLAAALGVGEVDAISAAHRGAGRLAPEAGAALEIGGESARFLLFGEPGSEGARPLLGFEVNAACSAGTGAFLAQEAHRFGLSIDEFGRRAAASRSELRIAGRCAVFAKTDAVHKHQNGVSLDDVAWGLCQAVADGIVSELIGDRAFAPPLVLLGGVAANPAVQRALLSRLALDEQGLRVPDAHALAPAIGATLVGSVRGGVGSVDLGEARKRLAAELWAERPDHRLPALAPPRGASAAAEPVADAPAAT